MNHNMLQKLLAVSMVAMIAAACGGPGIPAGDMYDPETNRPAQPVVEEENLEAKDYYDRGNAFKNDGDYELAIADYAQAIELDPVYAHAHNNLCWYGSLLGKATRLLPNCEQAVELAPQNGMYRDSRGLARALTGDYQGAIEDFEFYVRWSKDNGRYESHGVKRERWIAELKDKRNPFDAETVEVLLRE